MWKPESLESWLMFGGAAAAVFICGVRYVLEKVFRERGSQPPGPRGLPVIGSSLDMLLNSPMELLQTWSKKYGSVCQVNVLGSSMIIVSGEDCLREMLVTKSNDFAGRSQRFRYAHYLDGHDNIGLSSFSPKWVKMKRALVHALKMYGDRLQSLESITQNIISNMADNLQTLEGKPIIFKDIIHRAVTEIMGSIIFGQALNEKTSEELLRLNNEMFTSLCPFGNGFELDMLPCLRFLPNKNFQRLNDMIKFSSEWCQKQKSKYMCDLDNENPRSVLDSLAYSFRHTMDEKQRHLMSDEDLNKVLQDLSAGGTATTVSTCCAFVAIITEHQDIQKILQQEIDEVIGSRLPCLADRSKCHNLEAAILEILRYETVGPIGVPHQTTKDTSIGQYNIPKGTEVWPNFWCLHHDENIWDEPWKFKPERFLDEEGHLLHNGHPIRRRLMAFGAGRRICPGERLAKSRVFLSMAMMLQRFTFLPVEGEPPLPTDPRDYALSLVLEPQAFKVRMYPRHDNAHTRDNE